MLGLQQVMRMASRTASSLVPSLLSVDLHASVIGMRD